MKMWSGPQKIPISSVYGRCLLLLQQTRGMVAVRVAAERKHTSLDTWDYYRETEELMLQGIIRLQAEWRSGEPASRAWIDIAETLQHIRTRKLGSNPRDVRARSICEEIHGALAPLGETATNPDHRLGTATLHFERKEGE